MRKTTTILIAFLLTAGALFPLASAGWKYRGTNEPDTQFDELDGFMWDDTDTTNDQSNRRVYMNGYAHVAQVWLNPNVGALGSRNQPGTEVSMSVMLGIWKDCNGDGYIGLAEAGALEYRVELLTDTTTCPPQSIVVGNEPDFYPFNDGNWVREFLWIGDDPNNRRFNPTVFPIDGTKVWFDWGRPDQLPGTTCPTTGAISVRSTGAFLEWADCFTGYSGVRALNDAEDATGAPVGGWDLSDVEHSENTLNVPNPLWAPLYGEDGDGFGDGTLGRDHHASGERSERFATVWVCGEDSSEPNTNPEVNPEGSVYETGNETYNSVQHGNCKSDDPDSDQGLPYVALEGNTESQNADAGKDRASDHMIFGPGSRSRLNAASSVLGPYSPTDLGLTVERDLDTIGPSWRSNILWGRTPTPVTRAGEPTPAQYMTFYASLGSTSGLQLPNGGAVAVYGKMPGQPCNNIDFGVNAGWKCEPAAWQGRCTVDKIDAERCVLVGQEYHLRDIDCWDGRLVAGVPVYASSAMLGEPCGGGSQAIEP